MLGLRMRDLYYADKRDLVKWGILVELSRRNGAKHILQVLYYRPTLWPDLEIGGVQVRLPEDVRKHFRDSASICGLPCSASIEVVEDRFVDRDKYLQIVKKRIHARTESPGIVFLDPDTGLEPRSPGLEHVLESELQEVWRALTPGNVLVFYQHQTNRNGDPWIDQKKRQFERALGLSPRDVGIALSREIASDVVFFYAVSPTTTPVMMAARNSSPEIPNKAATIAAVLDCLNRTETRATYGAVASVIGGVAQDLGQRLGRRRPEASWVVKTSGLPTGYARHELHPHLEGSPLIRTGDELRALLHRCATENTGAKGDRSE